VRLHNDFRTGLSRNLGRGIGGSVIHDHDAFHMPTGVLDDLRDGRRFVKGWDNRYETQGAS